MEETTFTELTLAVERRVDVCTNPYHVHQNHVLELFALPYRDHRVSITKDGDCFSVRIDNNPLTDQHNLSWAEVEEYVNRMTK